LVGNAASDVRELLASTYGSGVAASAASACSRPAPVALLPQQAVMGAMKELSKLFADRREAVALFDESEPGVAAGRRQRHRGALEDGLDLRCVRFGFFWSIRATTPTT
jgi:hypothetical protein